jgi:uncharacterized protein (DUF362 family)
MHRDGLRKTSLLAVTPPLRRHLLYEGAHRIHAWTGVTLSLKIMFGIIPGYRYGWPKNVLHKVGIHESVLDIYATVRPHFVIADAIVAIQGDGPLNGTELRFGKVVLSDDPVVADATCTRALGLIPAQK